MSIVLSTAQFKYLYRTTSTISRVNLKWTANLLHLNTLFTQNMINAWSNFHRTLAHYLNRSSQLIERLVFVYMERVIKPPLTSLNKTQLLDRHFLFLYLRGSKCCTCYCWTKLHCLHSLKFYKTQRYMKKVYGWRAIHNFPISRKQNKMEDQH